MKRIIVFILLSFVIVNVSYAGLMRVEKIVDSTGNSTISVPSNTTTYTHSFPIKSGEYFGLYYKFTSATGSPNIAMELEESYELPTTEGSSDTEWVEPDNQSDIASGVTTEIQHSIALSPIPSPFARIKMTAAASSTNDTVADLRLIVVEED